MGTVLIKIMHLISFEFCSYSTMDYWRVFLWTPIHNKKHQALSTQDWWRSRWVLKKRRRLLVPQSRRCFFWEFDLQLWESALSLWELPIVLLCLNLTATQYGSRSSHGESASPLSLCISCFVLPKMMLTRARNTDIMVESIVAIELMPS